MSELKFVPQYYLYNGAFTKKSLISPFAILIQSAKAMGIKSRPCHFPELIHPEIQFADAKLLLPRVRDSRRKKLQGPGGSLFKDGPGPSA